MGQELSIRKIKDFDAWVARKGPHRIGSIKHDGDGWIFSATPVTDYEQVGLRAEQLQKIVDKMEGLK